MEIQKVLNKLKPLMPGQVRQWKQSLLFAQPEVRTLLERHILAIAAKTLGDINNRLLLSLPPKKLSSAPLHLGTILYEKEKWDFGLNYKEVMQNIAIFGRSGAGKTNVSFQLMKRLVNKKIPFLFLDWKRTARHLIPSLKKEVKVCTPGRSLAPFPFNPFIVPPGIDQNTYVNQLVDVMADAYTLGDGATSILQRAIHGCYAKGLVAPSINDVVAMVDSAPTNQRSTGWKISARRACESLQLSESVGENAKSQLAFAKSLLKQSTIIELDGISQNTKKFLIPLLCYWIYSVQLASNSREKLQFVIFLEEAHHVLYRHESRAKETVMNVLLRQCRELGIGVVLIDQHPHLISSAGIGNCYTTICMNLKDPSDINKAAGISGLEDGDKRFYNLLPVGQGIVKLQDRYRQPFLVQFPLVNAVKGSVTDELIKKLHAGAISLDELKDQIGVQQHKANERKNALTMDANSVALLHDVVRFPLDGVDTRYKRLGVSVDKGNQWKEQLVENGLIQADKIKAGRAYRVVLRLTDEAQALLVSRPGQDPQASFLHEYWKRRIAENFAKRGFKVSIEKARSKGGGNMDISATRASENVAIEIETGKSNVVSNVKRDLLSRVSRVIVVATDNDAFDTVERQLAKAGLLIAGRVEVVLQDDMSA